MSDPESQNDTCSQDGESDSDSESVAGNNERTDSPRPPSCVKLQLDDHIKAFMEKAEMEREVEPMTCSSELMDKVFSNYIIAKQILSVMSWQDRLICERVCTTWHSAIQALRKEQMAPVDYLLDLHTKKINTWAVFKKSGNFSNEPLVVMNFTVGIGVDLKCFCKKIDPRPCAEPCQNDHSLLDALQKFTSGPKECLSTVRTDHLSYFPLHNSITYKHSFLQLKVQPHMVGVYIPKIPGVKFHTINLKSLDNMRDDFYNVINDIAKDRIFKGIFVYVTDKYLLNSVQDIIFLNHFKDVQPDIPYAIGGCIIEDAFEQSDIGGVVDSINEYREFFSDNLITISMFSVPKTFNNEFNFDMFSLVLDKSYWSKPKIQQGINEFAKRVPHFEHSVAIKLACVGRDKKHKWEQDCFRAVFPKTRIVGCYGNGEIGADHPQKPPEVQNATPKRHCPVTGNQFGYVYSYSSVFVYMGWGKILVNASS